MKLHSNKCDVLLNVYRVNAKEEICICMHTYAGLHLLCCDLESLGGEHKYECFHV